MINLEELDWKPINEYQLEIDGNIDYVEGMIIKWKTGEYSLVGSETMGAYTAGCGCCCTAHKDYIELIDKFAILRFNPPLENA